jgi:hypothetical protein
VAQIREDALGFRPSRKSGTMLDRMEHQAQSEGRWMSTMLGINTGIPTRPKNRSAPTLRNTGLTADTGGKVIYQF